MDFIKTYQAFDKEFCEEVIKHFEHNAEIGATLVRRDGFRQDSQQEFNATFSLVDSTDFRNSELAGVFFQKLVLCIGDYINELGLQTALSPVNFRHMIVQRTESKFEQYSTYHCEADHLGTCDRALVYMLYLNDNFEGGETEFLYQRQNRFLSRVN